MKFFKANIKEGKFFSSKQYFDACIKNMPDGEYIHFLIPVNNKTPLEWQRYYRAILNEASLDTGESKNWLHEQLKADELPKILKKRKVGSTTALNSVQWKIYLEHVAQWLHEKYDYI